MIKLSPDQIKKAIALLEDCRRSARALAASGKQCGSDEFYKRELAKLRAELKDSANG